MDSVTRQVNRFYERYPYPSLAHFGGAYAPARHADRILAHLGLKARDFGPGQEVLDVGCGTGEISCSLAFGGAQVTALDLCKASLERAQATAKAHGIFTIGFARANLYDLPLPPGRQFDHVFSLGVLHHCVDGRRAFEAVAARVKPGGLLTLGLYSLFGKFKDRLDRQLFFLLAGPDTDARIDTAAKFLQRPPGKAPTDLERTYLADKHVHPHEIHLTVGTVLGWFENAGLDFVAASPSFDPRQPLLAELGWLWRRKAFFLVTGRKRIP